jgi:hypothetical protein
MNLADCEERLARRDRPCKYAREAVNQPMGAGDMRERYARDIGNRLGSPP